MGLYLWALCTHPSLTFACLSSSRTLFSLNPAESRDHAICHKRRELFNVCIFLACFLSVVVLGLVDLLYVYTNSHRHYTQSAIANILIYTAVIYSQVPVAIDIDPISMPVAQTWYGTRSLDDQIYDYVKFNDDIVIGHLMQIQPLLAGSRLCLV